MADFEFTVTADDLSEALDKIATEPALYLNDEQVEPPQDKPDQLYMDLTFLVSGHCNQTLKMHKDIPAIQVIESLNDGTMMTSIQEGSQCIVTETSEVVATIVDVDNECSYEDFDDSTNFKGAGGRYTLEPADGNAGSAGAMRAVYLEGDDE